ncbi:Ionotropic receptor 676 [Blattella germanica]|nr:Ionotropic receptor 676 [Blattella germanica]
MDTAEVLTFELCYMYRSIYLVQPNLAQADQLLMKNVQSEAGKNIFLIAFAQNYSGIPIFLEAVIPTSELLLVYVVTSLETEFDASLVSLFLEAFSNHKIYNVIILIPSQKINNEVRSLDLYTWKPFEPVTNCGKFKNVVKEDKWGFEGQGSFTTNTNLFPKITPVNFKKCPIIISSITQKIGFDNTEISPIARFVELDLVLILGQKLNLHPTYDYQVEKIVFPDIFIGAPPLNSLNGFNFSAANRFLGTYTHFTTQLKWYIPCPKPIFRHGNILRVFAIPLWLCLISVAILTAITVHYLNTRTISLNKTLPKPDFTSIFLKIWGLMLSTSTDFGVLNFKFRTVVIFWVVFCFFVSIIFQSFFTTFLVEPGVENKISNVKELIESGIERRTSKFQYNIWKNVFDKNGISVIVDEQFSIEKSLVRYIVHNNIAIIGDASQVDIYCRLAGAVLKFTCCHLEDQIFSVYYSMIITRSSFFGSLVNKLLIRIIETGVIKKLELNAEVITKLATNHLQVKSISKFLLVNTSGYFSLAVYHLNVTFYLLLMGYIASIITFIIECTHYYILRYFK